MIKALHARRVRRVAAFVFGIFLAWEVVTQSLAAYLATIAPQATLWLHPHQPEALVNLVDRALRASQTTNTSSADSADPNSEPPAKTTARANLASGDVAAYAPNLDRAFSAFETVGQNESVSRPLPPQNAAAVRKWAEIAVEKDPLNARALRALGELAEADGDDSEAAKFMLAAARLSLHEGVAAYWLMRRSVQAKDYKNAVYYADVLLRANPEFDTHVAPILARIAADGSSVGLLNALLAAAPPWRGSFFAELPNHVTDARIPLELLLALRPSATPPTAQELGYYIKFLIAHKMYGLAYYTWLQFLPPEELRSASFLFNGNFEAAPSGLPFDWEIIQGPGVSIDVLTRPEKGADHVLRVAFEYGRVDYHSVTQLVILASGTYEFKGKYKGELVGPRGLKWRVVCADQTATSVGESATILGMSPRWKEFEFSFTVPDKGCGAQQVRLDLDARMASERMVSGAVLFGQLQISRLSKPRP